MMGYRRRLRQTFSPRYRSVVHEPSKNRSQRPESLEKPQVYIDPSLPHHFRYSNDIDAIGSGVSRYPIFTVIFSPSPGDFFPGRVVSDWSGQAASKQARKGTSEQASKQAGRQARKEEGKQRASKQAVHDVWD